MNHPGSDDARGCPRRIQRTPRSPSPEGHWASLCHCDTKLLAVSRSPTAGGTDRAVPSLAGDRRLHRGADTARAGSEGFTAGPGDAMIRPCPLSRCAAPRATRPSNSTVRRDPSRSWHLNTPPSMRTSGVARCPAPGPLSGSNLCRADPLGAGRAGAVSVQAGRVVGRTRGAAPSHRRTPRNAGREPGSTRDTRRGPCRSRRSVQRSQARPSLSPSRPYGSLLGLCTVIDFIADGSCPQSTSPGVSS